MERKQEQKISDYRQKQGNPADEIVIYKIGGTFYEVSTSCGGSEPLFEKMKRLIKSENLKAPTDKGKGRWAISSPGCVSTSSTSC